MEIGRKIDREIREIRERQNWLRSSISLISLCTSALISLCLLLNPVAVIAHTDRQTHKFPLPAERALSLEITVGDVRIEGSPQSEALVEITRHTPNAEGLARIPILIEEGETEVRIRGTQADGGTDAAFRTDVTIRVPHDAVLRSVRILEGRLTLAALRGEISADVRRGPIEGTALQGVVRLETGIGNVIADRTRLSTSGLLRLRAFNGDVRLTLEEKPSDARILALALNGTIASDIPLRMKDTWGPRWGEATLGKGEPVISIDVITGRVEIRVQRSKFLEHLESRDHVRASAGEDHHEL